MANKELEAVQELKIVPDSGTVFGRRAQAFERMVDERESLREAEKQAKEERGYSDDGVRHPGLDDKIKQWMTDITGGIMLSDGRKVQVVERGGNEYVDVRLLLEAGVPAETIAKCKRRGRGSWHILVTYPKPQR